MPEDKYAFAPAAKLMQPNEIEALAKLFVSQGQSTVALENIDAGKIRNRSMSSIGG